jgi:isopenicillin N synthase-like dioxygenase
MSIPVLDLTHPRFVPDLHDALHTWGFVGLTGHGLPDALMARAYALAEALFALPAAVKRAHETPEDGRQRGFTPFQVEHAKDSAVGDLKEFWHVGRADAPHLPANRFPAELPELAPVALELFARLDTISLQVLAAVAEGLGLARDFFDAKVRGGNSVLRILHYPALPEDRADGAIRAAAHEDINLLTLLPVATEPGLELLDRRGRWVAVEPPPGTLVCDTGDMMQLLTVGRLPSTTHRVVNPPGGPAARLPRYSLPFFVHPLPDVRLDAIDGSTRGPTAGEFLAQRLRETGVG